MEFIELIKHLEALGMIGLSLAVAAGLAWVIVQRERDGLTQLKSAIDSLTIAIQETQKTNAQTFQFLERQAAETKALAADVRDVKADVSLMKQALVQVGVKSFSSTK